MKSKFATSQQTVEQEIPPLFLSSLYQSNQSATVDLTTNQDNDDNNTNVNPDTDISLPQCNYYFQLTNFHSINYWNLNN